MDSLTQLVLGATTFALIAPAHHRRTALVAGAVLGTLPDLDIIPLSLSGVDPVSFVTWHRGPSHSLLVLGLAGWLLWLLLRRVSTPVRESPARWFWAIQAALLTHPLLDAFTVYGTQLFWPLPGPPVMWASIFIIDPIYTLPLLMACAAAWWLRDRPSATWCLWIGMSLSSGYLAWSLAAKAIVEDEAQRALAEKGWKDVPYFSVPMPFNTLLWRVVAMTPDGFLEGERSLAVDRRPMIFRSYASDQAALKAVADFPSVQRLNWFTRRFLKAEAREGRLVLADLRMGAEPHYVFQYVVAENGPQGNWHRIPVERLSWPPRDRLRLAGLWRRIWKEPAAEQAGRDG